MLRLAEEGGDGRNDAVDEDAPRDGRPEDAGLFSDNGPPQSAGASAADCAVTVSSRHIESREPVLNPAMAPPRAAKVLRGPCSAPGRQNADTRTLEPGQSAPKSECTEEWFALPWQPHLALEPQGPQHRLPLKAATAPQCSQRGNTHTNCPDWRGQFHHKGHWKWPSAPASQKQLARRRVTNAHPSEKLIPQEQGFGNALSFTTHKMTSKNTRGHTSLNKQEEKAEFSRPSRAGAQVHTRAPAQRGPQDWRIEEAMPGARPPRATRSPAS